MGRVIESDPYTPSLSTQENNFDNKFSFLDSSLRMQMQALKMLEIISDKDLAMERRLATEDLLKFMWNPETWGIGMEHSKNRRNHLIVPGLFGSDAQYFVLDPYIERIGHRPQHAGILSNLGYKSTIDAVESKLVRSYMESGKPSTAEGHSLGGIVLKAATLRLIDRYKNGEFEEMPVDHIMFVASPADNSDVSANPNIENMALILQAKDPHGDGGAELLGGLMRPLPDYIEVDAVSVKTDFIVINGTGESNVTPHANNYSVNRGSHSLFHMNPEVLKLRSQLLSRS